MDLAMHEAGSRAEADFVRHASETGLAASGTFCAGSNEPVLQEPFDGLQASPLGNTGQRLHTVGGINALTDKSEEEKVEIFPGAPVGCKGHAMSL
jgi:hypothetical protein